MHRLARIALVAALFVSACGGTVASTSTPSATPDLSHRPSTSAKVTILSPTNGEVVHGTSVTVKIGLDGAVVTKTYSTVVDPTHGHVHLYLDKQLIYMAYTLQQDVPVHPGFQYTMYAEFVAADHFPFEPRDVTATIQFSVQP